MARGLHILLAFVALLATSTIAQGAVHTEAAAAAAATEPAVADASKPTEGLVEQDESKRSLSSVAKALHGHHAKMIPEDRKAANEAQHAKMAPAERKAANEERRAQHEKITPEQREE